MSTLLEVIQLKKYFPLRKGIFGKQVGAVKAVDGVSFNIKKGETLGIVGESGCGKSTTGRAILRLIEPTEGEILFNGTNVRGLKTEELRRFRTHMQIVFQDPFASLDPKWTIQKILEEPIRTHMKLPEAEVKNKVANLLEVVGLSGYHAQRYPHEFSGGQRQRIGIARALTLNPEFIVCDEPVSALDVSIQSQVLNLMRDLQDQFSLTYMFISHDLSVVRFISTQVGVMYLGRMVELASTKELFREALHPYTKALMSAVPVPDPDAPKNQIVLSGDVPNPSSPPPGCAFHTRCPMTKEICRCEAPEWKEVFPGHFLACHLY
ncbi:dipeptide ABC transporter ATP-binding protein [Desulfosporosinus sp. PR]|uniref:ABC transporter ATP-binding protein n=1 Tax=Candidatus Desulfosporosinus nitrosoreducens TaxID=3401928 RepID=UPI0027FC11BF|nr:dipeptide ABC transporter ATP-binding protein [Desulfosporosinus sp. PR]MDQ7096390.1 dipeptide ABC transporter ATP-binding protein [Desulfosporosinus sp. PR]